MSEREWIWVPVADILQTVKNSSDLGSDFQVSGLDYQEDLETDDQRTEFWRALIDYKAADSGFLKLVESIQEHGWTTALSWDPDTGMLGNGHHRMAAAILLAEDKVPTLPYGSGGDGPTPINSRYRGDDGVDYSLYLDDDEWRDAA